MEPGGAKRKGFFKCIIWRGKGKSHKKEEELLCGAIKKLSKKLTTELLYLELPTISASCVVKRYMHYIRFLLTETSLAKKFESIFPLGSIFIYSINFSINLQMTTE